MSHVEPDIGMPEMSRLDAAASSLHDRMSELENVVSVLSVRLSGVLTPDPPTENTVPEKLAKVEQRAPLTASLNEASERAMRQIDLLHKLINRLEV